MVELQDIEVINMDSINMNSSQYGDELNDRLQAIDSNFDALTSTDFLRGAQGETTGTLEITLGNPGDTSLGLYIEKSGDQTEDILVTMTLILSQIVSAINGTHGATHTENELLSQANSLRLIGRKLVVFYKTTYLNGQEKKYLVSSIPFVYYDPIYNSGVDTTAMANPGDLNDRSCAVAYNDQTQSFKAMHPFPQIYYDTEIGGGSLCWKINGQETSIPCQGPIGKTGLSSSLYIAYVKDTDSNVDGLGLTLREIYGVVKPIPNANSGEGYTVTLIEPSIFDSNNIIMREGDAIICLPVSKTTEVSNDGTTIDRYNLIAPTFISNILINGSGDAKTYYAIAADGYINNLTPGNLNAGSHLFDSLNSIGIRTWGEGDAAIVPMGLFIPAETSGSTTTPSVESYHMMWNDSTDDNSLNIGPVEDVASPSSVQSEKTLNVKYDTSNFRNIVSTSITGENADISETLTVNYIDASTVRVSDKIEGGLRIDGTLILGPDQCDDNKTYNPCHGDLSVQQLLTFVEEVNYSKLVSLRDDKELIPGKFYRITDYTTTTSQEDTSAASHPFDVIVLALTNDKLSEEAWATCTTRAGGNYFNWSHLEAWKLWYCLDNDTARFAWADTTNGKGVIYRMIDENGNDCPYDFKNILFDSKYTFTISIKHNGEYRYFDASIPCYENNVIYRPDNRTNAYALDSSICRDNKISYNLYSYNRDQSGSQTVTDLHKKLYKNLFEYDFNVLNQGDTIRINYYWVNNRIDGVYNTIRQKRGQGYSTKMISGNKLYNCFNVYVDAPSTQEGSFINNMLCNINYIDTHYDNFTIENILSDEHRYEFSGCNSFIFNGNIYANQVYQSNQ